MNKRFINGVLERTHALISENVKSDIVTALDHGERSGKTLIPLDQSALLRLVLKKEDWMAAVMWIAWRADFIKFAGERVRWSVESAMASEDEDGDSQVILIVKWRLV